MTRGYFGIGIVNGKTEHNIGTLWRAATLYEADFALGTIVGNVNDADVRDIHIPVPLPSGERAEPEEGAR